MEQGPALEISFDGESRLVPAYALPDLELAYAIICHKAQGSAFLKVIIPVVESRILDRTLIYVALTRAKRRVVFVGDH
ncbi:exodeoxyribonuclease V alpha subunit [Bradyrhizobium brasilense]|uniref:Exodeoxyribonuclease V alpha subunit n=2 Tax=Bradyrhizobium brasilense TaxID=1419277 RepID=A0A1G7PT73_9BRAD|nr:exodeoxyribonuclease V alpha subunit [Bradyrhizobium brasilense]